MASVLACCPTTHPTLPFRQTGEGLHIASRSWTELEKAAPSPDGKARQSGYGAVLVPMLLTMREPSSCGALGDVGMSASSVAQTAFTAGVTFHCPSRGHQYQSHQAGYCPTYPPSSQLCSYQYEGAPPSPSSVLAPYRTYEYDPRL